MKVVIIEDEILAADRLEKSIKELDNSIEVVKRLTSVSESKKWLNENSNFDLIFLDIQLSDGISFSIFEDVKISSPIIFTTAYDQYAIQAFKLNSVDYLLKPIRKSDLKDALQKFEQIRTSYLKQIENLFEYFKDQNENKENYKSRFLIQFGQKLKKVETENIAFFYALEKNVFLTTFENEHFPIDYSLDNLEEIVSPKLFFRINRKLLININAIKNMIPYSRSRIKIDLKPSAPALIEAIVSVERTSDFKKWLDK